MRVLSGLVNVIGDLVIHICRSYYAAKANREMAAETVEAPPELDRRAMYEAQISRDAIDCVDDPCVAATTMMAALASDGKALREEQAGAIADHISGIFQVPSQEAADMVSLAQWTLRAAYSLEDCLNRLGRVIHQCCSLEEKHQMMKMLEFAISLNQPENEFHIHAITRLKYRLGI